MTYPWKGRADPLGPADFKRAAQDLNVSDAVIRAVFEVEASGKFYRDDGTVERRFEPHKFPVMHWPALGFAPGRKAAWRASLAIKQADRERMFTKAYAIDKEATAKATSWGAPQIMGSNAGAAGYRTALAMVGDMADRSAAHVEAFAAFVKAEGLVPKLRAHDWRGFAARYNGNGKADEYGRKIEAAYQRISGKSSAVVLRLGSEGAGVRELQRALRIKVDGGFGPATEKAVKAFQTNHGLKADGVVGDKTWDAIRRGRPEVKPPAQKTDADVTARVAAISGALTAGSGAVAAVGDALPDTAVTILVIGAVAAALLALGAWLYLKARERVA